MVFYWLRCRFWSTLDRILTKIGDHQQKTCFLQNARHFLWVCCPKLSLFFTVFLPGHVTKSVKKKIELIESFKSLGPYMVFSFSSALNKDFNKLMWISVSKLLWKSIPGMRVVSMTDRKKSKSFWDGLFLFVEQLKVVV